MLVTSSFYRLSQEAVFSKINMTSINFDREPGTEQFKGWLYIDTSYIIHRERHSRRRTIALHFDSFIE